MSAIPSLSLSVGWLGFNVAFNNSYCACSLSLNSLHVNLSVPPYQCQKIMPGNFHYQALLASIIRQFHSSALSLVPVHILRDPAFTAAEVDPCLWNSLPTQCPSTWFVLGHHPPQNENVFYCSRNQRLVTVAFSCCVQIFSLTYLKSSSIAHLNICT